jgi:hypothetical protein
MHVLKQLEEVLRLLDAHVPSPVLEEGYESSAYADPKQQPGRRILRTQRGGISIKYQW